MAKCCKKVVPIVVAEDFDWDDVRPDIARLNFVFFFREQVSHFSLWHGAIVGIDRVRTALGFV